MDSNKEDSYTIDFSDLCSSVTVDDSIYISNPSSTTMNSSIYSHPTWTTTGTSGSWTITDTDLISPNTGKLQLNGEDADIEINGRSLMGVLDSLEQRLGLLKCREDLEQEWEELKTLGDQYRAKLAEIENKQKMWSTLKKMPPPRID